MSISKLFLLTFNIFPGLLIICFSFFAKVDADYEFSLLEPDKYNALIRSISDEQYSNKTQIATLSKYEDMGGDKSSLGFDSEKYLCRKSDLVFIHRRYKEETDTTLSLNIRDYKADKLSFLLLLGADRCILESTGGTPVDITVRVISKLGFNKGTYSDTECECIFEKKSESGGVKNNFSVHCKYNDNLIDTTGSKHGKTGSGVAILNNVSSVVSECAGKEVKPLEQVKMQKETYSSFFWRNNETFFGENPKLSGHMSAHEISLDSTNGDTRELNGSCSENEQRIIINIFYKILINIVKYTSKK